MERQRRLKYLRPKLGAGAGAWIVPKVNGERPGAGAG